MASKKLSMICMAASLLLPLTSYAQSLPMVSGVTYDGAEIKWSPLDGATGYNVHYLDETYSWSYLTTVGNVTSYVPGATGEYIIVGYDGKGNYSYFQYDENGEYQDSNTAKITSAVNTGMPVPPVASYPAGQLPIITGVAFDGTDIIWDVLNGATGYNVYYAAPEAGWKYTVTVGNVMRYVPEAAGDYIIVGYDNEGNYSSFQFNERGEYDDSNTVTITATDISGTSPPVADTPAGQLPIISGASFDGINITWNPLNEAVGYNVYFAGPGAGWIYTETIGNVTAYTPELRGEYLVVGYDGAGNFSPFQNEGGVNDTNSVFVKFEDAPAGELAIVTGLSFDGASIIWDALDNAVGYNVHYFYSGVGWSYLATVGNVTSYASEMGGDYIIVGFDDAGNYGPFQVNGGGNSNAITIR